MGQSCTSGSIAAQLGHLDHELSGRLSTIMRTVTSCERTINGGGGGGGVSRLWDFVEF